MLLGMQLQKYGVTNLMVSWLRVGQNVEGS